MTLALDWEHIRRSLRSVRIVSKKLAELRGMRACAYAGVGVGAGVGDWVCIGKQNKMGDLRVPFYATHFILRRRERAGRMGAMKTAGERRRKGKG